MNRRPRHSGWSEEDWETSDYSEASGRDTQIPATRRRRRRPSPVMEEEEPPFQEEETAIPEETEPVRRRRRRIPEMQEEPVDDYSGWSTGSGRDSGRRRDSQSSGFSVSAKLLVAATLIGVVLLVLVLIPKRQDKPDTQIQAPLPTQATLPPSASPAETLSPQTIPRPAESRYFRSKLSGQALDLYDAFAYCIDQHQPQSMEVFVSDLDLVSTVLDYLYWDYADYFWFRNYSYRSVETAGGYKVSLVPDYLCTKAERDQQQKVVDAAAQPIIDQLRGKSDYEKVLGVYCYLVDLFRYDLGYQDATLYEAFRDKRAVCEEYAKATKYILTKLGVETLYVVGHTIDGGTEGHAWNIVKVNGVYYQLDTTWGDPVMEDGSQILAYDYCMISDEVMQRDHIYDTSVYPACTAMDAHYFVKEGRYYFAYDKQRITELLRVPVANQEEIAFRFANEQAYQEAKTRLFEKDEIWDIVDALGWRGERNQYTQSANDKTYVISVTVSKS